VLTKDGLVDGVTPAQLEFFLPRVKSAIFFKFFKKIADNLSDLLAKFQKFCPVVGVLTL